MPPRTLAIGDIHGCFDQLDALLDAVQPNADDHLIFLGDLIDRGPDSAGVIKLVINLMKTHHVSVIRGNHEEMMQRARGDLSCLRDWVINGGDAALESYAGHRATLRDVPAEHWKFLDTQLIDYLETDTHVFVHANALHDHAMPDQPPYMLRWERCDNIKPHQSGKIIVCGHTPQKTGRPMNRGFAICIDTHAFGGLNLTAFDATSGKIWQANEALQISRAHISEFE